MKTNKLRAKLRKRRVPVLLVVIIIVFYLLISSKIEQKENEDNKEIFSFYKEYQEKGFPVTAQKIEKKMNLFYNELTLLKKDNQNYIAWIGENLKKKLKLDDKIYLQNNLGEKKLCGYISSIAKEIDYDTGLYNVKIKTTKELPQTIKFISAKVEMKSKDTIAINKRNLQCDEEGCFVFMIKNNKTYKQVVETGLSDETLIEIVSGISENDMIVSSDTRYLKDGLKVKIFENNQKRTLTQSFL